MIGKNISKFCLLCSVSVLTTACTYHKAMDAQKKRHETINVNLSEEKLKKIESEKERITLEEELKSLKSEVSGLDSEIARIEKKTNETTADNELKVKKEYEMQLEMLRNKKSSLEQSINEKQQLIEVYSY